MAATPDEELLERYFRSDGDSAGRAALDELFGRYHRRVALWCLRIAGDRDRALDIAQEVFLRAYRGLDSYRGGAKFSTWLYTVARNHCFNAVKARARRPEDAVDGEWLELLAASDDDPLRRLERAETVSLAHELLGTLEENERRAMVLHYREQLPLDVVTRLLGLTNASGAKAFIVSAKRKLKKAWERRQMQRRPAAEAGG